MNRVPAKEGDVDYEINQLVALIEPWKTIAVKGFMVEGKSLKAVERDLHAKGYDVTYPQITMFKKRLFDSMVDEEKSAIMQEYLLSSMGRVEKEFDSMFRKTKDLLDKYETTNDKYMQLIVIKEIREQIKMAMVKLGEYKQSVINVQNTTVVTSQDIVDRFRKMQFAFFQQMSAIQTGEAIVFEKPTIEFIDSFKRFEAIKRGIIKPTPEESELLEIEVTQNDEFERISE